MKASIAVLPLFLAVCCVPGHAQTAPPSITIGTHVLTLGMQESSVLVRLGSDLELKPIGESSSGSSWAISKKVGSTYQLMGSVYFDTSHHLTSAIRNWEVEDTSSKSLFYAISEATKSVESDGPAACNISTVNANQMIQSPSGGGTGSLDTKGVLIDCGSKQISIDLALSDAPGMTPSSIEVVEWLKGK